MDSLLIQDAFQPYYDSQAAFAVTVKRTGHRPPEQGRAPPGPDRTEANAHHERLERSDAAAKG